MKRKPLIPSYAYIPLGGALILNTLVYNGTKWITAGCPHHCFALKPDMLIPFCPAFISIYILAYFHWIIGYVMAARESRTFCYRMVAGDFVAKLVCLICFLVLPTTMQRPEITGTGIWESLTGIIYYFDSPVNLFPSIHCLESWICCRSAIRMSKAHPLYKTAMALFAVLVFASTVLVRQHVLVDIAGGILVAEIGLFAAKKYRLERIFERLNSTFSHRKQ